MATKILVLTDEAVKNILGGLGELPAKFSHAIILDIDAQLALAATDVPAHIASVETHLQHIKDANAK